ncbi:MAG: hypothetical protein Q9193_007297, partial [Seirophora villosa]
GGDGDVEAGEAGEAAEDEEGEEEGVERGAQAEREGCGGGGDAEGDLYSTFSRISVAFVSSVRNPM